MEIKYVEDGNIKSSIIDPWSTKLGRGEVQLWSYGNKVKGMFRKKVTESMQVTNFRILGVDHENNKVILLVLINNLDDVIVMNTRRVSQSSGYAMYTGYRTRYGTRSSNCKQQNAVDASFCNKCGSRLSIGDTVESSEGDSEVVEQSFRECILKEYNIKINYPSTWTRRDDTVGALKVMFQSPKESPTDQFLDGLGVSVDEGYRNMTLQNYIEGNIAELKKCNSDFTLFESIPTTVSGIPAHQIVYLANTLKFLVVAIARNNAFYCLQYCSKPESYLKFLSSAEQMISSFEFL